MENAVADVAVSLLRFSNVIGPEIVTPLTRLLNRPVVPSLFGFDPRFQFVHEDDVVNAIIHVLDHKTPGIFNVAGDGVLPWSEVAAMCGKKTFPLPFLATDSIGWALRRLKIVDLPTDYLQLLRYGRGVDNSRLKSTGFTYQYSSASAVRAFAEAMRLESIVGTSDPVYKYEREVEQFFRHSPAVVRPSAPAGDDTPST